MGYTEQLRQGMYGRMPGACYHSGKVIFWAVSEGEGDCYLLLFRKAEDTAKKRLRMRRIGNGSVFYTEISKRTADLYETYLFENDGGVFFDAYAKKVCGREVFGTFGREVRPFLPRSENESESESEFVCPAFSSLIFYKLHIRGFTKHPSSGVKHKGTFAGLEEKIPYLQELGINAVLLMPVYEFNECMQVSRGRGILSAKQLAQYEERYGSEFVKAQQAYEQDHEEIKTVEKVNYWGYTENNFYFAPKASYAADTAHADEELRHCVAALHKAGIAVFFEFFFGDKVKQGMVLDCLRYWTYAYGADGFRLIGSRTPLRLLLEDAYLSGVKFLVTDYDDGMQKLCEDFENRRVAVYNDGFRNVMRRFVKGDENMVGEFLSRLRSDVPEFAQVQYIADQNGFSLYDLYAYDRKHNEENGEENKDGENYNHSWNCGVEGETAKKKINMLRARLQKNALCTVFLSQSVPLLFAGDEFAHTKKGNNNAYCQDNEVSWLNWRLNKVRREELAFVKELIAFRKAHSILCGARSLRESDWKGVGVPDISYHGVMLWQPDFAPCSRTVSVLLCGEYTAEGKEKEDDIYLLFNMLWEPLSFALPKETGSYKKMKDWEVVLDTSAGCEIICEQEGKRYAVTADSSARELFCKVPARSVVVLTRSEEGSETSESSEEVL
ncbi:MAG: alpha-amylase [Lachnospiraceae bacterium]|nr:alpha-amylase [Lachnospiraceae bacterium]